MSSAKDFLQAIGRDVEKKVSVEKWEDLFRMRRDDFKILGVSVQDRRYIMWAMEKYRWGAEPTDFSHEAKPKKKYRGRGPRVQHGKRVR
ncbi:IGR protein motif-domain-containing protein [Cantharellus anzutake]|uniref:IGR protein motif-domain-containing protein n=1 Tax=Cantharellus anzutake TaxID=1750568 RepID=UPI001903F128|nr:IGR protein motif-domain-containing protein [Cantharellus anzutake]KAF8333144.1 IGR protein motif-domain-containing protein [Cantharellus anzutake]